VKEGVGNPASPISIFGVTYIIHLLDNLMSISFKMKSDLKFLKLEYLLPIRTHVAYLVIGAQHPTTCSTTPTTMQVGYALAL